MSRILEIEALFHQAFELPPGADRIQWVAGQCGEDTALLAEIASLLEAHGRMSIEISSASAPLHSEATVPTAPFGVYRAVEVLGRGGMSVVYRAERTDGQFDRTVALKVMAEYLAGPDFLRRFDTERRLLGSLSHHNITRLLDAGISPAGAPYLVTEYIDGQPIDRYCDERKLDIPARLRLFLQICDALDYAHRNLIVHRDLKPANILVEHGGIVKLLDFGTASLMSNQDVTVTRMRMLTPRYASPEQLRADRVNIATDIFSLGVVLYELLSGAWPFGDPGSVLSELNRATGEVPPRAPSTVITPESAERRSVQHGQLARMLSGDLSAIVLKAIEHDPARRYESVRAFAADVESHLASRPVRARPQTTVYRVQKFLRRRWLPVSAVAAGVVALSLTAGVALFQARAATREAQKAQTTSKFLQDMLATDNVVDKDITLRAMVDRAEAKLNRARIADPLVEAELRLWLAQSYLSRQEFEKVDRELDRAEALFRASGRRGDLARVASSRALRFDSNGDRKTARKYWDETIRICRNPSDRAGPEVCVDALINLLITHAPEFSPEQQKQLVAEAEQILQTNPGVDLSTRSGVLKSEARIAVRERRYADAGRVLTEALRLDRERQEPDDNAVATDLYQLADLQFRLGDLARAADYQRQRMNLFIRVSGPDAAIVGHAAASLAVVLAYEGNLNEARALADRAIEKTQASLGYQRLVPLFAAAMVRNFAGQGAEAEPYAREATGIALKTYPKTTSVYAEHSAELGISLLLQRRIEEALPLLQASDQVYTKLNIPTHPAGQRIHRYYREAVGSSR